MPLGTFPRGLNVPPPAKNSTPVDYAEALGETYLSFSKHNHRKSVGHYLTPATIARFMADCSSYSEPYMRVLDPGSGTGILSAAACEAASGGGTVKSLHVDAYETDPVLAGLTRLVLTFSHRWLGQRGVALTFDVRHGDFVLESAATLEAVSKANGHEGNDGSRTEYGLVISNPPYFKIGKDDPQSRRMGVHCAGAAQHLCPVHGDFRRAAIGVRGARLHRAEELCVRPLFPRDSGEDLLPTCCSRRYPSLRVQEGSIQESDRAPGEPDIHRPEAEGGRIGR